MLIHVAHTFYILDSLNTVQPSFRDTVEWNEVNAEATRLQRGCTVATSDCRESACVNDWQY